MAFIPTANTVKVCLNFVQNGQSTCQIFHVDVATNPNTALLIAVATKFRDWFISNGDAVVQDGTSLESIEATDISSAGAEGIIFNDGLPHAGAVEGEPLPNNCTVCTKLSSGLVGRSHRGRKYAVGLPASFLGPTKQVITDVAQAAFDAVYQQLMTDMIVEGWKLVVTSFVSGGVPRAAGVNTELIAATTNLVLDSQRRRLPERGT